MQTVDMMGQTAQDFGVGDFATDTNTNKKKSDSGCQQQNANQLWVMVFLVAILSLVQRRRS
jgi:hypothetical protein